MLTIIDNLARSRMLIRGGAPPQIGASLKQGYPAAAVGENTRGSKSGETSTYNTNRLFGRLVHQARRLTKPFPRTFSFCHEVKLIRFVKTSYSWLAIFSSN